MTFFKNKIILWSILSLSIILNLYFIYIKIKKESEIKNFQNTINNPKKVVTNPILYFKKEVLKISNNKPYYYYNTWSTFCMPCIKEMPHLDSIFNNKRAYFNCFFITDVNNDLAVNFIERKNIKARNFSFINNSGEFLQNLSSYKKEKTHSFPTHIIFNKNGEIVYLSDGAFLNNKDISAFNKSLDSLVNLIPQ